MISATRRSFFTREVHFLVDFSVSRFVTIVTSYIGVAEGGTPSPPYAEARVCAHVDPTCVLRRLSSVLASTQYSIYLSIYLSSLRKDHSPR